MARYSAEPTHGIGERLGLRWQMFDSSQIQVIRSTQQGRAEEPCFATDKHFYCGKDCEWREDCRARLAVWWG